MGRPGDPVGCRTGHSHGLRPTAPGKSSAGGVILADATAAAMTTYNPDTSWSLVK